jgi:hypothetical protein
MTTHHITDEHKPALARLQHILEWLQAERARIETEAAHIAAQGQRVESQLVAILMRNYGIDAQAAPFTLDTEAGTITTPDAPASAEPTQEPEPAATPFLARSEPDPEPS